MADTLKQWAEEGKLSLANLSDDGKSLSLDGGATLDAAEEVEVSFKGKSSRYTLASLFLQIIDPSQGLVALRNACKAHNVSDPVKANDKPTVVGFFLGADASDAGQQTTTTSSSSHKERKRSKHEKRDSSRKRHRETSSDKKKHRESFSPERKKKKQPKAPMTTEQLFSNLNVVVDKRATTESSKAEIHKALSAEGFDVTPEILAQHRPALDLIVPLEIPVGNSASILRPATAVNRNFTRVLELYNETIKPPSSSKSKSSKQAAKPKSSSQDRSHLIGKKPVIILPKGMSAPITMANGYEFFANSKYVPRNASRKVQKPPTTFTRKVAARFGGGVMEYELMDNPTTKLGKDASEWQRIVAVIALGASWQFADWPGQYKEPVELFNRTYGFYIGMEGDKLPQDVGNWKVSQGKLNRDKRGLDSVCYATFWNGLDEWMAVHKPEMMPQTNR